MKSFFTIITPNYLAYALALRESVFEFDSDIDFFIFISEEDAFLKEQVEQEYSRTKVLMPSDFSHEVLAGQIRLKYVNSYPDAYRWSMKPILMRHLLLLGYSACIYTDCDIHFYASTQFLYNLLSDYAILLTPHNRSLIAQTDSENFEKNFIEGIYNGGFFAASKSGIPALEWWAQACAYKCEKNTAIGLYDDQKYLDMMPARFEDVYSIKHPGCNLAEWNRVDCRREVVNGQILINGRYPVVFIHFTTGYPMEINFGGDALLKPHFLTYANRIKKYNPSIDLLQQTNNRYESWLNYKKQQKEGRNKKSEPLKKPGIKEWLKNIK